VDGALHLDAIVARPDGTRILRESRTGDDPLAVGEAAGEALLARGGAEILDEVYGTAPSPSASSNSGPVAGEVDH
jgi:hydroxymethylbilane synthase